jgi:hypothetical protein
MAEIGGSAWRAEYSTAWPGCAERHCRDNAALGRPRCTGNRLIGGTSAFFDDPKRAQTAGFVATSFEDELTTVLQHMEARRYADGELAIRVGEGDRSVHVVTEGRRVERV